MLKRSLVVLGVLAIGLVACGDKKGGGGGAGAKPADQLIGTWEIDIDALKKTDEFKKQMEKVPEAQRAMAEGMLSAIKADFEFTKDGKVKINMEMMGEKKTDEGSYKVKSSTADSVTLVVDTKEKKGEEMTVKFKDGNMFADMGGQTMAFKKK